MQTQVISAPAEPRYFGQAGYLSPCKQGLILCFTGSFRRTNFTDSSCWISNSPLSSFFYTSFSSILCELEKLETLILKPHRYCSDSYFVVHVISFLLSKEDDGKMLSWLHSCMKAFCSVIKSLLFCNVLVGIPVLVA